MRLSKNSARGLGKIILGVGLILALAGTPKVLMNADDIKSYDLYAGALVCAVSGSRYLRYSNRKD